MYRQVVVIPMNDKQTDIIVAFNNTSRYVDILNINDIYFVSVIRLINSSELQLNKANTSDTEASFVCF